MKTVLLSRYVPELYITTSIAFIKSSSGGLKPVDVIPLKTKYANDATIEQFGSENIQVNKIKSYGKKFMFQPIFSV